MTGLSYSNYSMLRTCGQKYKLSVLDKVPQPMNVNFEFGSALHAGLKCALETKDPDAAMDVFIAYWDSVSGKIPQYDRHGPEFLREMGTKFVANFTRRYGSKMSLIVGEQRMYATEANGVALEGTPDALVEFEGRNVLLDFKSSAYNYDDIKTHISQQLHLYAFLLEKNGFKVDALSYIVFNKGSGSIQTPYVVNYDNKVAEQMITEMVEYFKRNDGHYEKNPNACVMGKQVCAYVERCWKR